jgi:5-aminolevulinate synthase
MMGPKLAQIGQQRGYASVAGNREVEEIHKVSRVFPCADHELMGQAKNVAYNPSAAPSGKCPHAKAAQQAAAIAQQEAEKATMSDAHRPAAPKASGSFDYGSFYEVELEKKHKDKWASPSLRHEPMLMARSYRYFNNINRLAAKFTMAHTANVKDEVNVWCANDYLGMSKNPVVLSTMKWAFWRISWIA